MKDTKSKIEALIPLPIGVTEFGVWADEIIRLAKAPDNDSTRFALATMILHTPQEKHELPYSHFVGLLHKSMANQVAAGVMQDLKAKQETARAAATADATPTEVL